MPDPVRRVVLVGFMGVGKTTVGRLAAKRLGYSFEDMDQRIEARAGRSIQAIFREDGEEAFRAMERDEARALREVSHCVIAAGGGAFTQPETRASLQEGALTVWLRCDIETVLARIRPDGSRPLAGNHDIMRALLNAREAVYSMADMAVDAAGTPDQVAERVVTLVRQRLRNEAPEGDEAPGGR